MEKDIKNAYRKRLKKDQVITIPNILSFFRIALIPLIIYLYCFASSPLGALIVIVISGISDVVDGFIARKFNMITDFGKMIDPVADKLTQLAVLISLLSRFPWMLLPICIMALKEITSFVIRIFVFNKSEEVHSARWHGKLNTVILYAIMCLHIIWYEIDITISTICILVSSSLMILSFILYTIDDVKRLIKKEEKEKVETK